MGTREGRGTRQQEVGLAHTLAARGQEIAQGKVSVPVRVQVQVSVFDVLTPLSSFSPEAATGSMRPSANRRETVRAMH